MPLLPPGPIFHSISSSKSPNSSRLTSTATCPSLFSTPSSIRQPAGTLSLLYPRHASSDVPSNRIFIADCGLRLADLLGDWSIRGRCDDWTPLIAVPAMKTAAKHQSFIKQIMQRLLDSAQQKLRHSRPSCRRNQGISVSRRPAEPLQIRK